MILNEMNSQEREEIFPAREHEEPERGVSLRREDIREKKHHGLAARALAGRASRRDASVARDGSKRLAETVTAYRRVSPLASSTSARGDASLSVWAGPERSRYVPYSYT